MSSPTPTPVQDLAQALDVLNLDTKDTPAPTQDTDTDTINAPWEEDEGTETLEQKQAKHRVTVAVGHADHVLKRLIGYTIDCRPEDIFSVYTNHVSKLQLNDGTTGESYLMYLDIVDHDYMLDLKQFDGNPVVIQRMVFLLNCVKMLYPPICECMKMWSTSNNTTFDYILGPLANNTTMFLDKNVEKRIGIRLEKLVTS